jgi:LacI family transcriptional regulator
LTVFSSHVKVGKMQPERRPTVFDLEKATGVSRGTISRAFHNSPEINAATREMVLQTAAKIGYFPHPGASKMKLGRTNRWGLLIPHLKNPWYGELVEALDAEARKHRSTMLLGLTHYDPAMERALINYWAAGETDGIIVSSSGSDVNYESFARMQARGFPLVFLYGSPKRKFDCVMCDDKDSTEQVMEYLYEIGHRRIGYVSSKHDYCRETSGFRAYSKLLEKHGLPLREDFIHFGSDHIAGVEAWEKWRHPPARPTAVFCGSDIIACSLLQQAGDFGLRVPQDLSIVGFDDVAEASRAGLTTIRTDSKKFAEAVFELLLRPRDPQHSGKNSRTIASQMVFRRSVAAPSPSAPAA